MREPAYVPVPLHKSRLDVLKLDKTGPDIACWQDRGQSRLLKYRCFTVSNLTRADHAICLGIDLKILLIESIITYWIKSELWMIDF